MSVLLIGLIAFNAVGETHDSTSILAENPPFRSIPTQMIEYVSEPVVLRHRVIAIDADVLIAALGEAKWLEDISNAAPISFPLFEGVELFVQLTHARWFPGGWQAEYTILDPDQPPDSRVWNHGNLSISEETGNITASFWFRKRYFAVHSSGQSPYHVAVENDPSLLPATD